MEVTMIIDINKHDFTIIWDGIYYFALSNYPHISDWELQKLLKFIKYEKNHGRVSEIKCEDNEIARIITEALAYPDKYEACSRPAKITECTACKQKGCLTEYVCHTASVENAKSIISNKELLSAVRARKMSIDELVNENRNAAHDPSDFFDYIMFAWGNCQAGDRLVMERKLGCEPSEEDLSINFIPGIRFYYKYDTLIKRDNAVLDGYHALKLKDRLPLDNDLLAIIIPRCFEREFTDIVSEDLKTKIHYLSNDCKDIWDWSEKVYNYICML